MATRSAGAQGGEICGAAWLLSKYNYVFYTIFFFFWYIIFIIFFCFYKQIYFLWRPTNCVQMAKFIYPIPLYVCIGT